MNKIEKLLKAGVVKEVHFTTKLANVVMGPKSLRKWRMCVDFTDLNKACPKDASPLPSINKQVDGPLKAKFLSYIDAYFSYN